MYKLKFKCEKLTGDKIHSVDIDDSSLGDTWTTFNMDLKNEVQELCGNTHDLNVSFDTNDDGRDELSLCLYDLYMDEDKVVQTNYDDWIKCEIVEIDSNEFINEDEDYFYYNESNDKIECPICGRECYDSDLVTSDDVEEAEGCTDCVGEQKMFNVYYNDSGEDRSGLIEIMGLNNDHVTTRFENEFRGVIINEIEEA
jgi:hypothetical protein